jgi:hypothetical protein
MKRLFTLSVLFAALFTTIATNNIAMAQPESFTQDFLQEDYRNGEVVRTNVVTAVWDAGNGTLTFNNFFVSPYSKNLPAPVLNLIIQSSKINWQSDTKATFEWTQVYYGPLNVDYFPAFKRYYSLSNGATVYGYISPASTNRQSNPYLDAFDGTVPDYGLGSKCYGSIDLENEVITLGAWGHFVYKTYNTAPVRVIEYFEHSVLSPYKTDLVDIVNDGTVGKEYEVYDDLVGVTTVDGVLSAPMGVSRNQNSFMIEKGRYKLDLDLSTNALTVSQSAEDITGFVNNGSYPTYYVLGQANNNDWNPTVGQPMETTDGVHYSAVVNFDGRDNNKNYFSLTSGLANNNDQGGWDYVNGSCRLGPSDNNYPVTLGAVLFAKDLGKYKYPSEISDGQIDFLGQVAAEYAGNTKLQPVADFDQSNWVMLTGVSDPDNYLGKIIKGKSITGKLVDKVNPTIAVTSTPVAGDVTPYEPNIYIMPSFNEDYYSSNSHFFFVAPKVQEYAYITWACYNAADGNFYTMSDGNVDNLSGGIKVNWDYYPAGNPQDGYAYEFDAILRKVAPAASGAPLLKDGNQSEPVTDDLSAEYIVYPLRLIDVPTAINTVETSGKVVNVKYYNMLGIESATPFNGVNVVVTTYDNGNRTTTKRLYK